ncbi:MAG TPA: hypothetical protein VFO94_12245 [Gammaproteobacteria bacterium]|nr:hypothetical protein [Gammaproteobacteria bacterium]
MKRISLVCAALVGLGACGGAAAQGPGGDPFALGGGGGPIGGSFPSMGNGAGTFGVGTVPSPGIGLGTPGFGASGGGGCPFSLQILCAPLPGLSGGLVGPSSGGGGLLSSASSGGLTPGVISVQAPPPLNFAGSGSLGSGALGTSGSPVGGPAIGGSTPIGGANPATGLSGVINSFPSLPPSPNLVTPTPGSPSGGSAPIGTGTTGGSLPAPGAGGGGGPASPPGPSDFNNTFCTPGSLGCLP